MSLKLVQSVSSRWPTNVTNQKQIYAVCKQWPALHEHWLRTSSFNLRKVRESLSTLDPLVTWDSITYTSKLICARFIFSNKVNLKKKRLFTFHLEQEIKKGTTQENSKQVEFKVAILDFDSSAMWFR